MYIHITSYPSSCHFHYSRDQYISLKNEQNFYILIFHGSVDPKKQDLVEMTLSGHLPSRIHIRTNVPLSNNVNSADIGGI